MSVPQTPVDLNSPLKKAWDAYQTTEGFKNTKHWALVISPLFQVGSEAEKTRLYEILPLERREAHIQGSLWAAFMAGFIAAGGKP